MSIMEQNNIEEQVCDAIGILVNEGVESAGYDKTISAQVIECVDTLKGKYKIKYQDAYYYATSDNIEVEYTKNTQVYILVPGNDFSREKKIIGTVKDLGDAYVSTWNAENEYVVVGRNCAEIVAEEPLGLCSYKSGKYTLEELILYKKGASDNKLRIETTELKKYLEDSEKLRIGATFQTALADEQRQRGNYGISVKADFKDADNTGAIISKTFNLDVNSMIGMPYGFEIPSAQYLDFDIKGSNFIEITQVALLIADFPVEKDNYPEDIFISNFVIEGLAKPDAKVFTTYYLNITSSTGKYLTETDSKTTLEAILSLKNKTVTSSSLEYYWFIEDASVVTTHDLYCVYGGQGWRCLNDQKTIKEEITKPNGETEIQERKEWVPGSLIREVFRKDIPNIKSIYKCVCIYNSGKSSIAAEIELENTNPDYKFVMESTNGTEFILDRGKTTLKFLDSNKTPSTDLTYHWAKEDSSGGYHYLGSDHTGNGGELPVCEQFDNSTLMNHLRQLQMNYDTYLGNQLVATKSVYSEYSTFDAEKEEDRSVLKTGFDNSEVGKAKGIIVNLIKVLGFENKSPTNQELANAIQPYLDNISITYIDESTFYDIPARSILNYNVFKCTAMNGNTVLGTARIKLTNQHVSNDNGYIIIENGNQTFKYSAEGVTPTDKNNKNPLTLKPLTFKLYDEKGTEVTGIKDTDITWYYPLEHTLIKGDDEDEKSADGLWGIRHGQTFVFDIESRFKYEASNNVIKIEVKHQDRILKQDTSFSFIKDGMSGTNGTDYFCRIVPKYDLDNAYPTIVYNKVLGNESPIFLNKPEYTLSDGEDWFTVELWNGSELITPEGMEVIFKMLYPAASIPESYFSLIKIQNNKFYFDKTKETLDKLEDLDVVANSNFGKEDEEKRNQYKYGLLNILRAEVSYQGKKYFAELPIAVAIININEKVNNKTIDYGIYVKPGTGYNEVVYAADGARPQYANAYPFEIQVIRFEDEGNVELSTTFNNSKYGTTLKYDWTNNLGRYRQISYNGKNNKFLTREYVKDANGNNINTGRQRVITPSPYYNGASTDLGIKCIVTKNNGDPIGTLYFPIHFMLNKFGYSALNDWDGTSVEINEDDGYILSPQIGAGKKDNNNRFTGVLMGEMKSGHDADSDIGLLGFHQGERTIFLDAETGKAEFGKTNSGQIILDPSTKENNKPVAILKSGNYVEDTVNGEGLKINLSIPYIKYGNGKFSVSSDGILTARGADVRGPISSSSVNLYGNGYSDFEQIPKIQTVKKNDGTTSTLNEIYYDGHNIKSDADGNPGVTIGTYRHSGSKSLKVMNNNTTSGTNTYFTLGCEKRNWGKIKIKPRTGEENGIYIISVWVRTLSGKADIRIVVGEAESRDNSTISFDRGKGKTFTIQGSTWERISFEYTADYKTSDYYIGLRISNRTIGSTIYVDDIQIEEGWTGQEPSEYHPTGVTKIDGGTITTETITALGRITAGEFYIGDNNDGTLFRVDKNGYLYAQGARFDGDVIARSLELGDTVKIPSGNLTDNAKFIFKDTGIGVLTDEELESTSSGYFEVSTKGLLIAENAIIKGTIYAGAGKIANWNINTNTLSSQASTANGGKWIRISNTANNNVFVAGATALNDTEIPKAPFRVTRDGKLYATEAEIEGKITATSGTIGKCSIDSNGKLQVPAANITGTLTIGQLPGDVAQEGDIPTEAEITTITNNTIKTTNVTASNLKLSGSIDLNDKFTVSNAGVMTATSGTIGGWHIGSYRLVSYTNSSGDPKDSEDAATRIIQLASKYGSNAQSNAIYIAKRSSTSANWNPQFRVGWDGDVTLGGKLDGASGSFTGSLTADSTSFKKLVAGGTSISEKLMKLSFPTANHAEGHITIGDPNLTDWVEITIRPSEDDLGNLGTKNRRFNQFWSTHINELSDKKTKENIQLYNIEQAYEEFKNLPIYTYNFINKNRNTKGLKLGTMVDYIPAEVMFNTIDEDTQSFEISNLIFWDIAATQVIQQKLEETIQEKENLQNRLDILEQKFLEMEEKLNGLN